MMFGLGRAPGNRSAYTPLCSVGPACAYAYSTERQMVSTATAALQVYRSVDGTTQNVGFTSAGLVNTATVDGFCNAAVAGVISRNCLISEVFDQSGSEFGITDSLLGDEAADIFHGLAVKLHDERRVAEIAAALIDHITLGGVHTSIPPEQVVDLPTYQEEHWFHLGQGGLFRKRPEWKDG